MNMNSIIYCGIGFNCDCKPKKFKEFLENNLFHFCMSNEEVELFNLFSERLNVKDENGKPIRHRKTYPLESLMSEIIPAIDYYYMSTDGNIPYDKETEEYLGSFIDPYSFVFAVNTM